MNKWAGYITEYVSVFANAENTFRATLYNIYYDLTFVLYAAALYAWGRIIRV